jgi:hypothetical protein
MMSPLVVLTEHEMIASQGNGSGRDGISDLKFEI